MAELESVVTKFTALTKSY